MMLRHAVGLALAITLATALVALVSQAPAATGVQVADGTSAVEADPNAPDPVVNEESPTLPFNETVSSSSSFAQQNTSFSDDGTGITFDSVHHLSGSDLDLAFTAMVRRFTVTTNGLPVAITGLVADSGTGDGGGDLQTVVFRVAGGADVFSFNDQDDDDFSAQGTLAAGTYELEIQGSCSPGSGGTCSADIEAHLQLGESTTPDTTITSGPSGTTTSLDAAFTYSSSKPASTFECKLDAAAFASCPAAGKSFTGLADGAHTFSVRATSNGQTDPTPASRSWTVDSNCPDVQVGFATAQGCFTETESGVFETEQKAWVGGFEIQPRPGGSLVLSPGDPAVSAAGTGVDMIFAGFKVPIPVGVLPVDTSQATVQFGGGAGTVAEILDIPVEASVKVAWTDGGHSATYEQKVAIKKLTESIGRLVTPPGTVLGDFGGELKAKLENGVGFVLQRGELRIDKVTLLPDKLKVRREFGLRDLLLRFERKDNKPFWTGRAGITLPVGRRDLGFTGTVFVFDGSLAGGGLAIDGINKQLGGTPLFLQTISGDLLFAPRWGHDFAIKGSLGPRVRGKQLLTIAGQMKGGELITGSDCPSGDDPEKLVLSSKLTPLEPLELAGLASAQMSMRACSYPFAGLVPAMDVTATIGIEFARGALAYEASQTGFVSDRGANLEGAAQLTIPIPGLTGNTVGDSSVLSGSAIVSTKGTGACATLGFFDAGFGHRWGEGVPSAFTGCDLGPFRVTAGASTADVRAAQATAIEVPKGLPHVGFSATGRTAAPRVRVSGPGGFNVSSPAHGSALRSKQAVIAPVADERRTYVFVNDPRAGRWEVESLDPANALTKVSLARGLPEANVTGRVRKPRRNSKSKKFRFNYKLKRIPGQKVTFTERGEGIARKLGKARGADGTISFKPTIAANRKRTIEAEVVQDGLPRELLTVAEFKAPKQPKLKAPRVEATRKRASLKLSWARVRAAASYVAEVRAGRDVLFRVLTKKRKLRFRGTPKKGKLKVSVQAFSQTQPPGPTTRLRLKARR
jgi:hypothetical protein